MSAYELYELSLQDEVAAREVCDFLQVSPRRDQRLVPQWKCGPEMQVLRECFAMLRIEAEFPVRAVPEDGLMPYGYYFERIHGPLVFHSLEYCIRRLGSLALELRSLIQHIDKAFSLMSVPLEVSWLDILMSEENTTGLSLTVKYTGVLSPEKFMYRFAKVAVAYVKRLEDEHARMVSRVIEAVDASVAAKDAVISLSRTDFRENCVKKRHNSKAYLLEVEELLENSVSKDDVLDLDLSI